MSRIEGGVVTMESPKKEFFPQQLWRANFDECESDPTKITAKLHDLKNEAIRRRREQNPDGSEKGWGREFAENGYTKALSDKRRYPLNPNPNEYSEKFIKRTQKGFYEDIDNALKAHELSQQKLQKALQQEGTDGVMELFFPAYVDLVVQGYKPYKDLNA
jgi:hypothetical protein